MRNEGNAADGHFSAACKAKKNAFPQERGADAFVKNKYSVLPCAEI